MSYKISQKKKGRTALLTAAALLMTACQPSKPAEADVILLYTTDVHGACLPFDFKQNAEARTSLANVCTYVEQVRREHPDQVMLFDTGDYLQGQPSIYYYNFVDTASTHIVARTYNYLQYDAVGVGNHDIEAGPALYEKRMPHDLQMPLLCANAIDKRTGKPMFQPYTVIERQGIRIAILGLITPTIDNWLPQSLWPNLVFEDMVEAARKWVPIIRKEENPDLLIGLFHSGSEYSPENLDSPMLENGSVPVAIRVPGFDAVLCGHDHKARQFKVLNDAGDSVQIIDAQTQAAKVGRIDLHLSRRSDGGYDKEIRPTMIDMKAYPADSTYCATFRSVIDTVNAYVDAPIGQLTTDLPGIHGLFGPCPFMDMIHDGQLWATGADISLAAVLSPRDVISAGPITMRQLFSIYKYENQLFTIRLTGREVKQFLEYGFDRQFERMLSPQDHLIAFRKDSAGRIEQDQYGPTPLTYTFNYTSAAGIRYELDLRRPLGDRVNISSMSNGTPFHPDSTYLVAINSYQYSGGGGFITQGIGLDAEALAARTVDCSPKDVRSYLAEYIREQGVITPRLRGDWKIVPANWWQQAKERDMRFMKRER